MSASARALWITVSLLWATGARAQHLKAGFSMMETGPGSPSLLKGQVNYSRKHARLLWEVAFPNDTLIRIPARQGKPTLEEQASLSLFDRYLQSDGFSEALYRTRSDWKASINDDSLHSYSPAKLLEAGVQHQFKKGILLRSSVVFPDGRTITYLYAGYKVLTGRGSVPHQITLILEDKGVKTYKRLTLRNLQLSMSK